MYTGLIIKESIADENILDDLEIERAEIWKTENVPKYWTAISFKSNVKDFPYRLSKAIARGEHNVWYVDLLCEGVKYIVLKDIVLKYTVGDKRGKEEVLCKCRALGIPEDQLDWSE